MPHRVRPEQSPGLAQIRSHERIARLRTDKFSPTVMILIWIAFLSLHFVCFLYFAVAGWCYWKLPKTRLDAWLSMLYIGMGTEYHHMTALVHASVAMVHAAYIVWMIGWSCWKKDVVFAIYNVCKIPLNLDGIGDDWPVVAPLKDSIYFVYRATFTRDGFLGVDGPNFDFVLLCREIVETALQTQQAYRMSLLLPRRELNRGYVALLVLNCWSTALVHSVFRNHATRRRLLALVCDCILDLVSSVGVTTLLVAIYFPDFEFDTYGFPFLKWYEDVWRVHAMSEFQMVLVSSWSDLAMRYVFAMSMLGNLNNMKKLIRARPRKPIKRGTNARHRMTVVAPFHASLANLKKSMPNFDRVDRKSLHYWVGKATEIGFFVWGLVVLILHLHAESMAELPQCTIQVKPWTSSHPSCSLLELNCFESGVNGTRAEVTAQWSSFDPTTVVRVVIRHCPTLEIPVTLTEFSHMKEFKIYNSTITSWDERSAITEASHPMLTTLFLVRVSMTNGELPLGLQAHDFPQALEDIEFCVTDLRTLPEDLDLKWPQYASIYLEAGEFHEIPPSLVRLAPYDLSLSLNPISTIPKELFESESIAYLSFGGTLISELPEDVAQLASSVYDVNLSDTNISFFWSWIDPLAIVPAVAPPISAGNTPYCLDTQRILEGKQTSFPMAPLLVDGDADVSILLDASVDNWETLQRVVSCEQEDSTWYPLEFEDEYSKAI
ncbi:Centrosomal protein of 41 kDa [Phytophthora pseudosyringae]|uniref:Centrosomal protein of 41 kDa n=1 Tax=Phytophthora pseudosyringae TaxID=221518 RepID=A0A8T1VGW8_9STRA|nr:Centrosomal protein of 41 kDa [Phytophthora pseudosyringae]